MTSPFDELSSTSYALLTANEQDESKYADFISSIEAVETNLSDIDVIAAALKENPRLAVVRSAIEMTLIRTAVEDETGLSLRGSLNEDVCETLEELRAKFAHAEVLANPLAVDERPLPAPPPLRIRNSFWRRVIRPSFVRILLLSIPLLVLISYLLQVKAETIVYQGDLLQTAVGEKRYNLANLLFRVGWPIKKRKESLETMLQRAVRNDDLPMVKLLLNNGAEVELSTYSALTTACQYERLNMITLLLAHCKTKEHISASTSFLKSTLRFMTLDLLAALRKNGLKVNDGYWTNFTEKLPIEDLLEMLHEGRKHSGLAPLSDNAEKEVLILGIAKHGSLKTLKKALKFSASIESKDINGNTLIHMACHNHRKDLIEWLLSQNGKALSSQNDLGERPLHIACFNERAQIVGLLLDKGAQIDAQSKSGATPLLTIAGKMYADGAYHHGLAIVRTLCDHGADIELRDSWQDTAFSEACQEGNLSIAIELMKRGANQNVRDKEGDTPLIGALRNGQQKVAQYLIDVAKHDVTLANNDGATALLYSLRRGYRSLTKKLLQRGANPKNVTKSGNTALHFLAQGNCEEKDIDELLKLGIPINCQNKRGRTPLHYSLNREYHSYHYFLAKGASLEIRDNDGNGPLHFLGADGRVASLIKKGLDVNEKNKFGQTPLMFNLKRGITWTMLDFLKNGAKVDAKDNDGQSALHWLAKIEYKSDVRAKRDIDLLVYQGAQLDIADKAGYTPLLLACKHGSLATVRYLHHLDAKLDGKTKDGKSAIDLAKESKNIELLRWLKYKIGQ